MKTSKLLVMALFAMAFASCASPEERAARQNNPVDTNKTEPGAPMNAETLDSNQMDNASGSAAEGSAAVPAGVPTTGTPTATSTASTGAAPTPAEAPKKTMAGESLIKKSDCLACHSVKNKIVGPSYVSVAAKYPPTEENINHLAGKIIEGGAGAWGEIPMSPHPAISKADAKEMVKYILSLK